MEINASALHHIFLIEYSHKWKKPSTPYPKDGMGYIIFIRILKI